MSEKKEVIQKTDPKKSTEDVKENEIPKAEVLEDLPHEVKKVVEIGMSMQRFQGTVPSPIASKITENHIDKILELSAQDETNRFKFAKQGRWFNFAFVGLGIGLFIFITLYLAKDNTELFNDLIKILVAFAGGFGTGFGYKSFKDKK